MIPLRLELRNVRTYQHLDLDLPTGAVAICGPNGAGKSTLVSAIDVALFGAESRSLADWLSEDAPEETLMVSLTFEAAGEAYRVRRSYSGKGRGQTKVDLEARTTWVKDGSEGPWVPITRESAAATQIMIEEITGLTRDTFRASSFISAGTLFCDLAPREQKRILAELLDLGAWDGWLERARVGRRQAELDLSGVRGMLERAEPELAQAEILRTALVADRWRADGAKASLTSCLSGLATARVALSEAQARAASRAGAENALQQATGALTEWRAGITSREDALRALEARLELKPRLTQIAGSLPNLEAEQEEARARQAGWEERQRLVDARAETIRRRDAVCEQLDASLVLAGAVAVRPDAICDRCGQALHDEARDRAAQSHRDEAERLAHQLQQIDDGELAVLNTRLASLPAEQPDEAEVAALAAAVEKARAAREQVAALAEAETRRDALAGELSQMRAGLPSREEAVAAAGAELQALGPHDRGEMVQLQSQVHYQEGEEGRLRGVLSQAEQEIARHEERLQRLDRLATETAQAETERDSLLAELDVLAGLERACGPNGVPALILENMALPQIEQEANRILALFGSKAQGVELRTQREKRTGDLADTFEIVILTEHGSRPYSSWSTGEKLRINAAVTLALAQLIAARSAATGLLVIDDLGPLDSQGMAVLADICRDLASRVGRVYVISQAPELRDAFEQTLEIVSDGGRSRVVGTDTVAEMEAVS